MHLTALGNVHEVCKKALMLHCGGQELQFVAVNDVRPTVSDGLYSKCLTPPPTPPPYICLLYY